jgi:DNA repair and recombination protein RAD52
MGQPNGNHSLPAQPQTPNSGFARSNSGAGRGMPPPQDPGLQPRSMQPGPAGPPPVVGGRVLNQPSRTGPPSAPVSPTRLDKSDNIDAVGLPPQGAGFFSARAAAMLPEGQATEAQGPLARIPNHLPAFDPHAESPSIRKTPGVDHKSSKPLTRDGKHVPSSSQAAATAGARPSVGNPQLEGVRRIGAPGSPSRLQNRNNYKPPTMKRPIDGGGANVNVSRTPLLDMPANGPIGGGDSGGDAKRQRLNG